jgi:hypothetical protein
MSDISLSNVLLPAVFISSAVFSTLTVPFALIKSEPVVIELPPYFSGEIQPIFNGEHKDVAIPYIGFAIVASVGAGIASVEVHRRLQAYRESLESQEPSPNLQQNLVEKEAQPEALNPPEFRPEVSAISFTPTPEAFTSQSLNETQPETLEPPEFRPNVSAISFAPKPEAFTSQSSTTPNAITEAQDIAVEVPENAIDATQLFATIPHQTTEEVADSEELNLSQAFDGNNLVHLVSSQVSQESATQNLDLALSKILESRQQYQTCRIKVPHLERRLFAILVNGEYYSFFRAEKTREKVLEVMAKIGHGLQKMVLTKTEKGYVIWAWEPEVSS